MSLRPAWWLPVLALVLAAASLLAGAMPLSALLLVMPLCGVMALPPGWWRSWPSRVAVLSTPLWAAGLVLIQALPLQRAYPCALVPLPALLHGWCLAGLLLTGGAGLWRALRWRGRWPLRAAVALAGLAGAALVLALLGPLSLLYRAHLTAPDAAKVLDVGAATGLEIGGADGVRLAARFLVPRAAPAAGLPFRGVVVFTHGVGGWKEGFLNHQWLFLHAGWAVLTYDLRGHGRSSPAAVTYGAHEADDLVAVWARARALAGGRPLVAYGASMGAAITLDAAARLTRCRGLIIESPFADLGALLRSGLARPLVGVARALAWATGWDADAQRPAALAVLRSGPPVLLGWIADDATIPASQSAAVATACARAVTVVMPHGAHLDLIIYEPWRRAVVDFLAQACAASGSPEAQ